MYSLVALISCLAVASASICCAPPTWEGSVGFLTGIIHNGKVQISRGSALIAFDGIRHVIGEREFIDLGSRGRSTQIDVLMDFDHDLKYIREGSTCIKTKLNKVWQEPCVPDNATVIGLSDNLGYGSNSVDINSYMIDFGGVVQAYYSVTANGCIPVLESYRGELEGNRFLENVGFVNLTAGLADPSVLNTPPTGCENAPLVQAHYTHGSFNTAVPLGRRSLFGL